jgi:curved DNA-binding protein CbpA
MNEIWAFDPYEVLGVRRGATDQAIATAYRSLARRFHPDIAGDGATVRMMRINAAFDAIRTAKRRAEYDDGAAAWPVRPASSAASHGQAGPADAPTDRDRLRWTPERDGTGGAGAPPGRPSGSVLDFGRHIGWSIGEIARVDPGYLEWLANRREGQRYAAEIEAVLKRVGYRPDPPPMRAFHTGRLGFRRG